MVQEISNIKDIVWYRANNAANDKDISLLNDFLFTLPKTFIELLKISDGGYIDYDFDYFDLSFNNMTVGSIGEVYGVATESVESLNKYYDPFGSEYEQQEFLINYHDIINRYHDAPGFFPKNLVTFAQTGNGDMVCFDYRADPTTNNPPVVYWNHEAYEGEDISFVANNFDEFITMLREPEPYPGEEDLEQK